MSHDEWRERADLYALGALDGEELGRFEDHIDAGCDACERQVREAREALLQLPRALPLARGPSPDVKRRLMAEIARESPGLRSGTGPARGRRGLSWGRVGLAASVALLVGLASLAAWDDWNLRGQLRDLAAEAARLRSGLVQRKDVIHYLDDPGVAIISLAGLAPSPNASGRVLWRAADRSGYVLSRGLPPAPAGRKYAAWAIAASGPVPLGLFDDEEIRRAFFRLRSTAAQPAEPPLAFAVTLEPASGGKSPTGPVQLRGTIAASSQAAHRDIGPRPTSARNAGPASARGRSLVLASMPRGAGSH
ncbi:Anti-sigma-K factor rskA (plasmid) [Aquisphaera giovannonii]|uniref:Regulator of SigK n=1 Tax=Aquisphaera giovannonii TaxID=406548 RepID=A0A5B9WFC6_9BACT|nr:anti-sigma factor [Aquisphaera giovannonii]QEH39247.1 Anti-sigma-K factor rskA [Aquisphaera giovannonii]